MTVRVSTPRLLTAAALLGGVIGAGAAVPSDLAQLDFFEKKIRPVLVAKCVECHSDAAAQAKRLKGGLRLDSRDGLLRMYQKLLVEKEQRMHDLVAMGRDGLEGGPLPDYRRVLRSRSWRLIMALHRFKHRMTVMARRLVRG